MKTTKNPKHPFAALIAAGLLALGAQPAAAGTVTISSTPLATAGGSSILPNLLFVLDSSGSMDWEYLGDYVNDSGKCMLRSSDSTTCTAGDPPYSAGGVNGFNGVAYDPMYNYRPGLKSDGTTVLASPLTVTSVPNDAYGAQSSSNSNLTTGVQDLRYCNSNNVCKRNGADNAGTTLVSGTDYLGRTMGAGRFPYRTHDSNSSTQIFGLPEMMAIGTFTRSSGTVTVTTIAPHGLATNDRVYVTGSGTSNIDIDAGQVTVVDANTFTYTNGTGSTSSRQASYRKHSTGSFSRSSTTVTVTATAHGLVNNDIILVNTSNSGLNANSASVTVTDADTFKYTVGSSGTISATAGTWVRTGLYNDRGTTTGTAYSYYITPYEYCSDVNLTNCVEVIPPATPPVGFTFPAYVRFCRTQEQALAPGLVSDASGTPRCRSKLVGSGSTKWTYPRFGYFNRDIIQSGTATYARSAARTDCAAAPTCSYSEEIQNYARWWTYYKSRMQMMKTAAGRAFQPFISNPSATPAVPDKLRVGFITINPFYNNSSSPSDQGSVQSSRYLKIDAFNTTQAANWYAKFYAQIPAQGTPLREALSRAGWMFAGKLDTGLTRGIPAADDPVLASCQRHFTLLTSDGYWNGNAGQNLSGNSIGNLDNLNPTVDSPYSASTPVVDRTTTGTFDGGVGTVVATTTPTVTLEQVICTGNSTTQFSGGLSSQTSCGCSTGEHRIKQRTTSSNNTISTTDGVQTGNSTTSSYTFQNITACSPALVVTQQAPAQRLQQAICTGSGTFSFGQGSNVACGCPANYKKVMQQTGDRTHTIVTTDGSVSSDTYSSYVYSATDITGCRALVTQTTTPINEVDEETCRGSNSTAFGSSPNLGSISGGETSCGCTGSNRRAMRRTLDYNRIQTRHDGTLTSTTYTSPTITFTALTSCGNSGSPDTSVDVNVGTGVTATTDPGPTVTSADFTLSPNPQIVDPSGATVTTGSTGTALTIALSPNPSIPTVGTVTSTTTPGGYSNTLADVAMYYFRSDLRGGTDPFGNSTGPALNLGGTGTTDVSANTVPARAGSKDFVTHQHMVTFSVGLVDGLMRYQSDYETATTGDFANIKNGTNNGCFWVSGTCNWPQPIADDASALDDLWHAAVNGRGQYYLAANADTLSSGIQTALTAVNAQVAAAAASATSSPNVTQTDNQIFSTTYETNTWSGKVFAQTIDPSTGNVSSAIQWQADQQLVGKVAAASDSRSIYTFDTAGGTKVKAFTWANLTAAEQAFFLNKCVPTSTMTQCTGLTAGQLTTANDGTSLVGFLRGWSGNEGTIFRDRTYIDVANNNTVVQTVLGDTISAKPAYLRRPQFNYADAVTPSYSSFLTANETRSPRVYVAANDGYLHAFHGDTGEEMWAYLPRFLMPGLYALADTGYASLHRYFADGSPETGEVFDATASAWKSILVAGVSGGGRGFYALDITDPSNPKGLWEFCSDATLCAISDADLGLSYGNPVIGKRASDGKWIVVVTSGLNNVGPGTGIGYFYVLDAITGAILDKVPTTAGSLATPSGLMKVSAFYDSALTDATFRYAYAGDQLGNVWRLDTSTSPPTVLHIATLNDASTPPRAQPITTRPSLTRISGQRVLYIGTGRYLGAPDLADPGAASGISWQQTLYAFKDKDGDYGDLRVNGNMVVQTLTMLNPTDRGITTNPVDWNVKDGWYVDFNPSFSGVENSPGEGVNLVDPRLVLGTLVVTTNVPAAGGDSCSVGGSSFNYNFDFKTGQAVSTSAGGVVGRSLGGTITVGVAIVQLPSGAIKAISTGADTSKTTSAVNTSSSGAAVRRFSYRVR
jgi:type IV pilus assembly protein PilY1